MTATKTIQETAMNTKNLLLTALAVVAMATGATRPVSSTARSRSM